MDMFAGCAYRTVKQFTSRSQERSYLCEDFTVQFNRKLAKLFGGDGKDSKCCNSKILFADYREAPERMLFLKSKIKL